MLNSKLSTSGFLHGPENNTFVRFTCLPHNLNWLRYKRGEFIIWHWNIFTSGLYLNNKFFGAFQKKTMWMKSWICHRELVKKERAGQKSIGGDLHLFHSWKSKDWKCVAFDIRVKDCMLASSMVTRWQIGGDTSGELGDGAIQSCSQFPTATTTEGRCWWAADKNCHH